MIRRFWNQDCLSGLMFVAFGVAGLWIGLDYRLGTATRMGPGYFPILVSFGLVCFGVLGVVRSLIIRVEPLSGGRLRPLLVMLGAVVLFALVLRPLGLALSVGLLVLVAALAGDDSRVREVAALVAGLALFAVVVFVWLLGIPFKVWPM